MHNKIIVHQDLWPFNDFADVTLVYKDTDTKTKTNQLKVFQPKFIFEYVILEFSITCNILGWGGKI